VTSCLNRFRKLWSVQPHGEISVRHFISEVCNFA